MIHRLENTVALLDKIVNKLLAITTEIEESESILISIGEAKRITGLSFDTLRRYVRKGFLTDYRTDGGHRRFKKCELKNLHEMRRRRAK